MPLTKQVQDIPYIRAVLNLPVSMIQINFRAAMHKQFIPAARDGNDAFGRDSEHTEAIATCPQSTDLNWALLSNISFRPKICLKNPYIHISDFALLFLVYLEIIDVNIKLTSFNTVYRWALLSTKSKILLFDKPDFCSIRELPGIRRGIRLKGLSRKPGWAVLLPWYKGYKRLSHIPCPSWPWRKGDQSFCFLELLDLRSRLRRAVGNKISQ